MLCSDNRIYDHRKVIFGEPLSMMPYRQWKLHMLMIFLACLYATDGARILGIFPMPAKSHMTVHSALMKELARRGHEVTVFSPYPEKFPISNLTDIELKVSYSELLPSSGKYSILFYLNCIEGNVKVSNFSKC
jgi:hypothetical protein